MNIRNLNIKIFADGADYKTIINSNNNTLISGFTTNPTLMRKDGVKNYKNFAQKILSKINKKPVSFEVFADDFDKMFEQAKIISSWSDNVNVKIPITNTKGKSSIDLIKELHSQKVKLNITAVFTLDQISELKKVLIFDTYNIISVFAGRIADTGIDPIPIMKEAKKILSNSSTDLLWASPREVLNILQAEECNVDIITLTSDLIKKLNYIGKPLDTFSLETVDMFYKDAKASGYTL